MYLMIDVIEIELLPIAFAEIFKSLNCARLGFFLIPQNFMNQLVVKYFVGRSHTLEEKSHNFG